MATSILLKFLTLKWNISRTIWHIEVGDGSFFCILHALSFELNVFRPEVPYKSSGKILCKMHLLKIAAKDVEI